MANDTLPIEEQQFIERGRLFGSDQVALECSEAAARWQRDLKILAAYGFGTQALTEFQTLRELHQKERIARPEAVARKQLAVKQRGMGPLPPLPRHLSARASNELISQRKLDYPWDHEERSPRPTPWTSHWTSPDFSPTSSRGGGECRRFAALAPKAAAVALAVRRGRLQGEGREDAVLSAAAADGW